MEHVLGSVILLGLFFRVECWQDGFGGAADSAGPPRGGGTLVVFEEVDSLVEEDKGFLTALAGLVLDSKARVVWASGGLRHKEAAPPSETAEVV